MRFLPASVFGIALLAGGAAQAADLAPPRAPSPILSPDPSGPASAFTLGPVIGLDGLGFQVGYRHNASLGARATVSILRYDDRLTAGALRMKGTVDFVNASAMVDWYPFENGLRVSGGLRFGKSKVKVRGEASADGSFDIGENGYPLSAVTGSAEYNPVAPVLTVGYEWVPSSTLPLAIALDIGAAYLGGPNVKLVAEGSDAVLTNPQFQKDLADQKASLKRELDKWPVMPVLSLAALYRF